MVQEFENTGSFAAILKINVLLQRWTLKQGSTAGLEVSSHGHRITCVLKTQHNLQKNEVDVYFKYVISSKAYVTILTLNGYWRQRMTNS